MEKLIRKLSFNNEISIRIYDKSKPKKIKNTPIQLLIDGVLSSINTNISGRESQNYNIAMKWHYLLNDCLICLRI